MFSKDRDFVLTENETLMFKRNRRTPTISDINIHLYMWLSWFFDPHVKHYSFTLSELIYSKLLQSL